MKMTRLSFGLLALVGMLCLQSSYAGMFNNKAKKIVYVAAGDEAVLPTYEYFTAVEKGGNIDFGESEYLFVYPDGAKYAIQYRLPVNDNVRLTRDRVGTYKFGYLKKSLNKKLGKGDYKPQKVDAKNLREFLKGAKGKKGRVIREDFDARAYEALGVKKGASPYAVLGIEEGVSARKAKTAYRKLSMKWHPDRCRIANENLSADVDCAVVNGLINAAYEALQD